MNVKMQKGTLNGKAPGKPGSSLGKNKLRTFTQKNFARLQLKYPFLPKSQVRWKVRTLWEKLNLKNGVDFLEESENRKTTTFRKDWQQVEEANPKCQLTEKQNSPEAKDKDKTPFGNDFLLDLFPDSAEDFVGSPSKNDQDIVEFSELFLDNETKIFL